MNSAPVFIVGAMRSGTTLLSLMLDSHSRIAIPYESLFFISYYQKRNELGDLSSHDGRLRLVEMILAEPYPSRWDQQISPQEVDLDKCTNLSATIDQIFSTYAKRFGKDIWGDKTPKYSRFIYILNDLFPAARYVHIVRDGRDVAPSLIKEEMGPDSFYTGLTYWAGTVAAARGMLYMLPRDRFVEVRFEDLVSDPEVELRRIVKLLGVDFEPSMLGAYQTAAERKVGGFINTCHVHLREPPSKTQAYKWKKRLCLADQALAYHLAGEMLEAYGYEPGAKKHPLRTWRGYHHRLKARLSSLIHE